MGNTHVGMVWNPSKTTREELERALAGIEAGGISWFETTEDDPGQGMTQRAIDAGVDLVLAAGGDGTVRAVAEHLADVRAVVDLGILPLGTGNLLARNLDIPVDDLCAAVRQAFDGRPRQIDIGWAEVATADGWQRHAFAVMAGFGIDAHMITETNDDLKSKAGWLAYLESLGRAVSASEVIDVDLTVDRQETSERAHTIIVGNCGTLQGGITLLPDADPTDGELDLLVLHTDGVAGWLDTMRTMVWNNGLKRIISPRNDGATAESSQSTTHRRGESIEINLSQPRVFEVDGDDIGEVTSIKITLQPSAIRVR